jgi:Kelch motif.
MYCFSKILLASIILLFCTNLLCAQSVDWAWVEGSDRGNSTGVFGTKGVADIANECPARYQAAYWMDKDGNFWVFGGSNNGGNLNDLWRYNPTTNEWTWMNGPQAGMGNAAGVLSIQGVPSPLNYPPALGYGSNCWTDTAGNLWLYGGFSFSTIASSMLFRYTISTNEWTWMSGSSASNVLPIYGPKGVYGANFIPGGRQECKSGWEYDNKLWLGIL